MKRLVITLALAAVLLVALAAQAGASTAVWQPSVVAEFAAGDYGAFAESLAADSHGDLFATVTSWGMEADVGEVWKITPRGHMTRVATIDVGPGLLTGIAFDAAGDLYVAAATFSDAPLPGVFRIESDGSATRVMTLPVQSFPNGLACRQSYLYVSDSSLGAVWRASSAAGATPSAPSAPWFKNALLKPSMNGLGANGIAFRGNQLFIAASDSGRIVRLPVTADGSAGALTVVANFKALRSADGIAFDSRGGLWITTNHGVGGATGLSGGLYRLSPTGTLETIASNPGWLDYPSMPAFGTTPRTRTTLFVTNGSFEIGTPNLIALDADVAGLPLN